MFEDDDAPAPTSSPLRRTLTAAAIAAGLVVGGFGLTSAWANNNGAGDHGHCHGHDGGYHGGTDTDPVDIRT